MMEIGSLISNVEKYSDMNIAGSIIRPGKSSAKGACIGLAIGERQRDGS